MEDHGNHEVKSGRVVVVVVGLESLKFDSNHVKVMLMIAMFFFFSPQYQCSSKDDVYIYDMWDFPISHL